MNADREQVNKISPDSDGLKGELQGGIWSTPSPSIEPEIMLIGWSVFELPSGTRHFVGYNVRHSEGRVSTPIISWDAEQQQGVTRSGRRYQLVGDPGSDPDGLYVWGWYSQGSAYVDVTHEYVSKLDSDVEGGTP